MSERGEPGIPASSERGPSGPARDAESGQVVDDAEAAEAVLQRYIKAQEDFDIETLVSCWHPDVEIQHPLRPDRGWSGRETYRQIWSRQWKTGGSKNEIVSTAVVGNRVYLEAVVAHGDGTRVPNMNVFEIEDGMIRRGRVYTDVPTRDGVKITDFARDHEGSEAS